MSRLLFLAGLCCLLSATVTAAETHPFSIHDMLAMERISGPAVSPDGKVVAFNLRTTDLEANKGRYDIYLAAVDGSWTRRLTTHEAADTQPRWSPDGESLYFISSRSGSSQVWRLPLKGGEAQQVTDLPLDVDGLKVSATGTHLVFAMGVFPGKCPKETKAALDEKAESKVTGMLYDKLFVRHWDSWKDGTRNHIFAFSLEDGKVVDLMKAMDADCPTKPFGGPEDFTIAPDGSRVVFSARDVGREEAWSTNFDLYEAPLDASAPPRKITTNPAWDAQPLFSPDGKTLAYLAMARAGFEADRFRIVLRDLASGRERSIDLRADDSPRGDRSPGAMAWSQDGRELVCSADHLGQRALFAVDVASGKSRMIVGQGTAGSQSPLPDGRVLYSLHSLLGPTELSVVDRGGKTASRITHVNDSRVAAARFGKPEQFSFTGAKGEKVYAYLVHPVDFDPAKKYPVAFMIHGGPQGSFGNEFHYRWNPQTYTGAGYATLAIDFHASVGYGQDFTDAVTGDWGGAPLEDLKLGLAYALEKYPFLDGARVGAIGASYGGYMINWIAGAWPDRFKCLVCHDGNLDERLAYYDTEELWFPEWEHGGVPWENPEGYEKHNPINLVKNWKTPMLVIHGARDYRVVDTQGLSTFTALQRRGIPSKLLYFPDENHWVLKPANSILWHETVIGWLDEWLK